jgi:hypothetical protein
MLAINPDGGAVLFGESTETIVNASGAKLYVVGSIQSTTGFIGTSLSNTADVTIQSSGSYLKLLSNNSAGVIVKSSNDTDYSMRFTNNQDTHGIDIRVYDDTFNVEKRPIISGVTNTGDAITNTHSLWLCPYDTTDKIICGNLKESDFGVGTMKLGVEGHILCDGIYTNSTLRLGAAARLFTLPTETTDYTTAYDTSSITLQQLAERVRALQYILGEQGLLSN